MRKLLTTLLTILTYTAFGQVDQTIWNNLKTIKTDNYELKIPYKWRQMPNIGQVPEHFFEASGFALPTTYNGSPVIITIFFVKQGGADLEDCKEKCMSGYRDNLDREFPENFKDGQEKILLTNGQEAYILNTRFYRKSKGLNQSRYDLVVFSEKAKTGYIYTLSIQYADSDYKFETQNNLVDFAKRLYSFVTIKK